MEKLSRSNKRIWYKLIDAPLNEQKARLLMMVLLLHHNGAAKIGSNFQLIKVVEGSSRRRFHTLRWEKNLLEDQRRDQELFRSK
ncbi:unnamed protein product [Brassica rapa subsp. narinosa]